MDQVLTPWQRIESPELKRQFAALLRVRPDTPQGRFEAACLVFPKNEDSGLAVMAADRWPYDPIVIEELGRLRKVEPAINLPSREEQARDLYNIANDPTRSVDDRLKAHKLYAEVQGFIRKPGESGTTVNIDNRRVMMVREPPKTIEDWEAGAIPQQARLLADASQ